jgi:ssRNA-specific RNase YbeY (16S rRNA maturation enzyme)
MNSVLTIIWIWTANDLNYIYVAFLDVQEILKLEEEIRLKRQPSEILSLSFRG